MRVLLLILMPPQKKDRVAKVKKNENKKNENKKNTHIHNKNINMSTIPTLHNITCEDGFILPPHGPELINYIAQLYIPCKDNSSDVESLLHRAICNVPVADVELVMDHINKHSLLSVESPKSPDKLKEQCTIQVALIRLSNRICEHCGDKSNILRLQLCSECALSWYCNSTCQAAHWDTHKRRCCQVNGPLDMGYQQLAFVKLKN